MSEKEQQTTAAAQSTTTKDNTPARLKIEQEYNDKRSGWQRYYKVTTTTTTTTSNNHCTCTSRRSTATVEAKVESGHSHTCRGNNTHTSRISDAQTLLFLFDSISTKMWWVRKRLLQMPMPPTHTHTARTCAYTDKLACIHECLCVCVCRTATRGQPHCAIIAVVVAVAVMWACVCVCGFWCLRWSATTTAAAAQLRSLASSLWRSRNVWPIFSQTHTHMLASILTHSHTHTQTQSAHLLHFACALSRLLLLDAAATAICCCYCLFFALRSLSLQFAQIRISVAIFFCTSFCTCKLREQCVREWETAMGTRVCAMRIAEIGKEGNASERRSEREL